MKNLKLVIQLASSPVVSSLLFLILSKLGLFGRIHDGMKCVRRHQSCGCKTDGFGFLWRWSAPLHDGVPMGFLVDESFSWRLLGLVLQLLKGRALVVDDTLIPEDPHLLLAFFQSGILLVQGEAIFFHHLLREFLMLILLLELFDLLLGFGSFLLPLQSFLIFPFELIAELVMSSAISS